MRVGAIIIPGSNETGGCNPIGGIPGVVIGVPWGDPIATSSGYSRGEYRVGPAGRICAESWYSLFNGGPPKLRLLFAVTNRAWLAYPTDKRTHKESLKYARYVLWTKVACIGGIFPFGAEMVWRSFWKGKFSAPVVVIIVAVKLS
jgi:hypothetical protein